MILRPWGREHGAHSSKLLESDYRFEATTPTIIAWDWEVSLEVVHVMGDYSFEHSDGHGQPGMVIVVL